MWKFGGKKSPCLCNSPLTLREWQGTPLKKCWFFPWDTSESLGGQGHPSPLHHLVQGQVRAPIFWNVTQSLMQVLAGGAPAWWSKWLRDASAQEGYVSLKAPPLPLPPEDSSCIFFLHDFYKSRHALCRQFARDVKTYKQIICSHTPLKSSMLAPQHFPLCEHLHPALVSILSQ